MRNIALKLSFLGTHYHGWQVQGELPTLQQTLSRAVSRLVGEPVVVRGCSRTDAGVHALTYVAHFFTATAIPLPACVAGLNNLLPPDIAVSHACEMPEQFDARKDTLTKTYRYMMYESPTRQPWLAPTAWWRRSALDVAAMQQAAGQFCGTHDFRAFCAANDTSRSKQRMVQACTVRRLSRHEAFPLYCPPAPPACRQARRTPPPVPDVVLFDITANAFLKQMVRLIAGTLVKVGEGKLAPAAIPELLRSADRRLVGACAPPQGLWLLSIQYPEMFPFDSR